ncbi:hypothetical protein C8R44DRAFT_870417 [Mycena epipterygia]|nr:hypothetical protein C8R44DRAFT_870417 [Mycena epipterygia]
MSKTFKYGAITARNITLDDYDSLPDASYRDKIENVVIRAINSGHVQALLAPRGPIYPMDIFASARATLDREPDLTQNALYFSAISSVLCRALGSLHPPSVSPPSIPDSGPTIEDRRALQKRVVASVHQYPRHPLRIQVLRHMHLKWTIAMNSRGSGSGYGSDESSSDEDELELVLTAREF